MLRGSTRPRSASSRRRQGHCHTDPDAEDANRLAGRSRCCRRPLLVSGLQLKAETSYAGSLPPKEQGSEARPPPSEHHKGSSS
eukprot:1836067-Rhodomonas_salina.3